MAMAQWIRKVTGVGMGARQPVAGTAADDSDMRRMNRRQELNRVYSTVTLMGYGVLLGGTWPFALITGTLSLTNGGPGGAIWVFIAVCLGMSTSVLSMAEMASIEPTAGGQYHWVSVFAPPKWRKRLSYIVGWLCALGWQSIVPGGANVAASVIQSFAVVASDSYVPKSYHVVLLTIAICTFAVFFNLFLARKLPGIEAAVFTLYSLTFVVVFIVLLALGDRSSAKEVFTDFQDNANWGSIGAACFVGVSGPVITLIGADSAVHLAEEMKDASKELPRAMLLTAAVNYAVGFLMTLAFLFVLGNVEEILATPTGQPWVQVLWNTTQSRAPTIVITVLVAFFILFGAVNANTTSSRQLFAFSRDGGLPCSRWIGAVSPYRNIPLNAVILTWAIGCILALIPLGSTAAFVNIQTIGTSGLLTSYIICIACRIHHRNTVRPTDNLQKTPPFFLGKTMGNIVNVLAVLFLICFLVSGVFPQAPNPTVESMNWSSMALGTTVVIACTCYIFLRKTYLGPNVGHHQIEGETINMETSAKSFDPQV